MGVLPEACFNRMCEWLSPQLPSLKTVEVLNMAWACAKLGYKHEGLLAALVEDVYGRVRTLAVRDACQMAWALATLGKKTPGVYRLLANHATERLGELQPPDSIMLLWSLARAGVGQDEAGVMGRVADHVLLHVDDHSLPQLSSAAWALAHA